VIPDTNKDGIAEVVFSHGGDPDFPPENITSRYPGRLILLDGATGHMIGRFVDTPDRRETYNSPVLHHNTEEKFLLLGTGGETAPGRFQEFRYTEPFNLKYKDPCFS